MKIVHVIISLNVGGAELMLKRLVESHRENSRYQHCVISLMDSGRLGKELKELGVQVIPLGMRTLLDGPRIFRHLVHQLRQLQPDVVQTWMYHSDLVGGIAARYVGISNVIWGVRTTDVHKGGNKVTTLVRQLCAKFSSRIPRIIVCAAEASRRAHVSIGYDASRMLVIPNGFDLTKLKATDEQRNCLRKSLGISDNDLVVGSVARYSPVKDHHNFIAAVPSLAAKYQNIRFMMIGSNVEEHNELLMQRIKEAGFADRFVLLGERKDVPICLKAMDIYCLHSRTEGFPNSLGEAMALGLPCVSTDVGDARYLLGETGVVVPAENPEALARGIEQIVSLSSEERRRIGRKAAKRVRECFSMQQAAQRFAELYESLVA